MRYGIALAALATSWVSAPVSAANFLLENVPFGPRQSVVVTDAGLTLTITTTNGTVVDINDPTVPLLGQRAAIGGDFFGGGGSQLRYSFDQLVSSATFDFGDAGGDDDSAVFIFAYDSLGALIGTATTDYPQGFATGKSLTLNTVGARSFVLTSGLGGPNPNSILSQARDVVVAGAVPEPTTWAMMISGFSMVGGAMRLARRKAKVHFSFA